MNRRFLLTSALGVILSTGARADDPVEVDTADTAAEAADLAATARAADANEVPMLLGPIAPEVLDEACARVATNSKQPSYLCAVDED